MLGWFLAYLSMNWPQAYMSPPWTEAVCSVRVESHFRRGRGTRLQSLKYKEIHSHCESLVLRDQQEPASGCGDRF